VSDIRDREKDKFTDTDTSHGHELKKEVMRRHWMVGEKEKVIFLVYSEVNRVGGV